MLFIVCKHCLFLETTVTEKSLDAIFDMTFLKVADVCYLRTEDNEIAHPSSHVLEALLLVRNYVTVQVTM